MTEIATTIAKEDSCPDITVNNTTVYPANTSHDRTNFKEFVRYSLQLPNNTVQPFSSGYPHNVQPPADSLQMVLETCLVGKYIATYIALPTPPDTEIPGQSTSYNGGDNFYYDGVIYNVSMAPELTLGIPAEGFTNAELIADYLSDGRLTVISEDEIASKYKSEITFLSWCSVLTCLMDKLEKLNCLIVKEPTRNDICEMPLYSEVLQLNLIYYEIVNNYSSYVEDAKAEYEVQSMANYVNSICCCKKQNCC